MITRICPNVRVTTPPPIDYHAYFKYSQLAKVLGDMVGCYRYGDQVWIENLSPSEEKLRIWKPPSIRKAEIPILDIQVIPYQWSELQRQRQIQPIGNFKDSDPLKWMLNAVVLTANASILTADGYLIFHRKRGGAKNGSIHAFGGYVTRKDITDRKIESTIKRELEEEIGLREEELEILGYYGTPEGMPAILWNFGTGAVYASVRTGLTSTELEDRLRQKEDEETLELFKLNKKDIRRLPSRDFNIHPQTSLVVSTMEALYLPLCELH